jgi:heme-degrading monooxygenase HmoA
MVLEIGDITVTAGSEADFIAGYQVARAALAGAPGSRSVRLTHSIETPTRFVLLVEWDSVDAHLAFRASDAFADWRGPIGQFFAGPPNVEHFADV